jgi:hypothetical protein
MCLLCTKTDRWVSHPLYTAFHDLQNVKQSASLRRRAECPGAVQVSATEVEAESCADPGLTRLQASDVHVGCR